MPTLLAPAVPLASTAAESGVGEGCERDPLGNLDLFFSRIPSPSDSMEPRRYRRFALDLPQQAGFGGRHLLRALRIAHAVRLLIQPCEADILFEVAGCAGETLELLVQRGIILCLVVPPSFAPFVVAYRREPARTMKVQIPIQEIGRASC